MKCTGLPVLTLCNRENLIKSRLLYCFCDWKGWKEPAISYRSEKKSDYLSISILLREVKADFSKYFVNLPRVTQKDVLGNCSLVAYLVGMPT